MTQQGGKARRKIQVQPNSRGAGFQPRPRELPKSPQSWQAAPGTRARDGALTGTPQVGGTFARARGGGQLVSHLGSCKAKALAVLTCVRISGPWSLRCVLLDETFIDPVPQFPLLNNRDNISTFLLGFLSAWNEIIPVDSLAQCLMHNEH